MAHMYNDPVGGKQSTIGPQINTHYYERKALIEARKEAYFGQLADVFSMPKNMGKTIKKFHYIPLLDDANINDQGIDATGATIKNGNLYGSSKDIGTIPDKLPLVGEGGGRVNRVGFSRVMLEGTFEKFGFFTEYSAESMHFDSDAELLEHINREAINGAMEITEDALQIDLLTQGKTLAYPGAATKKADMTHKDQITYQDLRRVSITLDNNRTPKKTTIITGTRNVDTKTIPSARVLYIGSELIPLVEGMKDVHGNPAFTPIEKYAAGTTTLNGEIGALYQFRIVVVPEMMKWAGAGAAVAAGGEGFHATDGKYDVFPMLVVGDESFTTIGFQSDGKNQKFKIIHRAPGEATADRTDPYGETGFISIKWWYGFMLLRGERIAVIHTTAPL
ncbi:TPA: N4-gp56 family major capsid protein [Acinetobacter baumannii]|uniref:N4-gp56 family major capsid protein n=1 Tax=Acinetobacter baumannii TaxID=470 RepID=UPI00338EDC0D